MMWTLVFVAVVALSVTAEKDYSPEEYEYDDYEENNEDNGQESPVDFSAFKKVTIRSQSQNIRVAAGGTIRLPCMVDNLPAGLQQSLLWKRLDKANTIITVGERVLSRDYTKRARVSLDRRGSSLTLLLAEEEDAGKYQCRINMGEKSVSVEHSVRVETTGAAGRLVLQEGDDMILSCNTSDHRPVIWSWEEGRLPSGEMEHQGAVLRINSTRRSQGGRYHCKVGTSIEREVVVEVVYKPEISIAEVMMSSITGSLAELVCSVRGRPPPTVGWSRAGKEVKQDRRTTMSWKGERNSLTIVEPGEDDLGPYTCTATNSQGSTEKSIVLTGDVSSATIQTLGAVPALLFVIFSVQA